MTKLNVVDFHNFKEKKELKRMEESYRRYLKTLGNSQLEIEINHLLEEFSGDDYGKDFHSKIPLIFKEISFRASGPIKAKIESLQSETIKLI